MRDQDRYCCSNNVLTGSCANGWGIRRIQIEERVLAGLRDRLMAPEAAAEARKAYGKETNRRNRERRASGATDRAALAEIENRIASMIAAIEEGGYVRGMSDRLHELEARRHEITERLADVPDTPTSPSSAAARSSGSPRRWRARATATRRRAPSES